ncbi:MAG: type IV secretion system DNA-binding domain-containing protein [Candidatus Peribacteraceae bacterium]|nr:type IV secretion system DNA-binding domain-containing protein [Candidatus Peribacteraceae bacterium]MDD5742342.1 type IV secretion system DNA-binding domain-containing protein [Candidatus Peribacteraceae bacterium]
MATLRYLHIVVPQGKKENRKLESRFQDLLVSLRNTVTEERFSFEYFGYEQYTYFYAVMDEKYKETIEGLIYASFPDAEIRETKDYTELMHPEKHHLAGCELTLKERDVYPVKMYDKFEEDSMSRLFSVISKIDSGEQVWVQIVVEPHADDAFFHFFRSWRYKFANLKKFFSVRDRLRKEGRRGIQNVRSEAAKQKEQTKPFKVSIRCAYLSKSFEEASRKLEAVKNCFYHFNDSDINGFISSKAVGSASFLRSFRQRQHAGTYILSAAEVATLYHLPNADYVHHIVHVLARKSDPPQDLPRAGEKEVSTFGITNYHNNFVKFGVRLEDRRRHLYVVGKSGVGKSKLLELLIKEDLERGRGVAVLDPHGDLVDCVLKHVPKSRIEDVILFDPGDTEFPIAFNPLAKVDEAYKMQLTIGFLDIFKKLFGDNWTYRLEHVLRYTTLALLDSPNTTVLSILKMLNDKNYRQKIVARIQDNVVKSFWVSEFAAWSEKFDAEAITPLLNKVGQFVATNMIRNIIGQPTAQFDIRDVMDNKKILLMKVSKGLLGEENSSLIGSMIITKMYQAAMSRANVEEEKRPDFYFYVDEFQNFATDTFYEILSEARKYHLDLTIAHQYMGQLSSRIRQTVFGNVGSMISFRVGAEDAAVLEKEYEPIFKERDIINLGVREFYIKMSVKGEIREAFSGRTVDVPKAKEDHTREIIDRSRAKYCNPKKKVEEMLRKWDEAAAAPPKEDEVSSVEEKFEEPII